MVENQQIQKKTSKYININTIKIIVVVLIVCAIFVVIFENNGIPDCNIRMIKAICTIECDDNKITINKIDGISIDDNYCFQINGYNKKCDFTKERNIRCFMSKNDYTNAINNNINICDKIITIYTNNEVNYNEKYSSYEHYCGYDTVYLLLKFIYGTLFSCTVIYIIKKFAYIIP